MITNFEEITKPLTNCERLIIDALIEVLGLYHKDNPIKAPQLVNAVMKKGVKKFGQVRLRKMINFIRGNSILPVIATSRGYYISYDTGEIQREINSLEDRAETIKFASRGMQTILKNKNQLRMIL